MIENVSFQDDDTEESVVACTLEADLIQNNSGNDEAIIIVDMRRIWKKVRTKIVSMSCKGDLDFLWHRSVISEHLRSWTHERIPGIHRNLDDRDTNECANVLGTIAEDIHLIQCDQMFTGTEDDQDEWHKVSADTDTERAGDALEEADRGAVPPEQIPLLSHTEFRPYTSNHGMRIDVFEITDSGDMHSLHMFNYALTEERV